MSSLPDDGPAWWRHVEVDQLTGSCQQISRAVATFICLVDDGNSEQTMTQPMPSASQSQNGHSERTPVSGPQSV